MITDLFGYGDIERWVIIGFILFGIYFLWTNPNELYTNRIKWLLTIPRLYILAYEIIVITDIYKVFLPIASFVITGIGSTYGLLLLCGVETYIRWTNKKYGRR